MAQDPAAFDRRPRCDGRSCPGRPRAAAHSAAGASLPRAAVRGCLLIGLLICAHPAAAQLSPTPADFPVGELYRLELLGSLWPPAQDLTVASRGSGLSGSTTSPAGDPGASAPRFLDGRVRLRLSRRQRVHLDYLPIRYAADTALDDRPAPGDAGVETGGPVASTLTWKTWRLAYEYDVIHLARGYLGLLGEVRYTTQEGAPGTGCDAATPACELAHLRRPVPGVGGVVRLYPSPVIMLGAEASLLRTPPGIGKILGYTGEHLTYDVHAALNFVEAFGLQLGYRSRRLRLETADHDVDLKLEGVYVGALLRF